MITDDKFIQIQILMNENNKVVRFNDLLLSMITQANKIFMSKF